jgi:Alpha/beta hydrolase family
MRRLKWVFMGIGILLILSLSGFIIWASNPAAAMPEAQQAMISDNSIEIQKDPWLVFQPTGETPDTGLIIYPGGRVDPVAYAPAARRIAENGYLVVIVPMPLNLAVFGANQAKEIISAYPEVQNWVIAGHSLGGAMAARFADMNPEITDGLVLWAAYPAKSNDLSTSDLKSMSISGSQDGLSTPAKIQDSLSLLPPDTQGVVIQGGNHGQFGWYGLQSGDNEATITRSEQQEQIIQATLALLESVSQ